MIDASRGFIKDGNKNRLRERDIQKILDIFNKQEDRPRFSRMVPFNEIADSKNDYNLNLPRYIDGSEPEDIQDMDGHLRGGIPERDIDDLDAYWQVIPGVRSMLFESAGRTGYFQLTHPITEVKSAILEHGEFASFNSLVTDIFNKWLTANKPRLKGFDKKGHPKQLIATIAEDLLNTFREAPLMDAYDVYQHLMDYWADTMQDDFYLIAADGWKAETHRVLEEVKSGTKKGEMKDKGWACDLIPKPYIIARYFAKEQAELDELQSQLEAVGAGLTELAEEHGGDEGIQRVERFPVPRPALREAVLNALVHRVYAVPAPVQIRVYEDRLSIWNPALLPRGWTVEKLRGEHASIPFNPDMANAFFRAGEIEAWGRGIHQIFQSCLDAGGPEPRLHYEPNELLLEFPFSENYLRALDLHQAAEGDMEASVKTSEALLKLLERNPKMTLAEAAAHIGRTVRAVEMASAKLVKAGKLRYVGPQKGGHWEVIP